MVTGIKNLGKLMHLGKLRHKINVSSEFSQLAKNDELAATCLATSGHFKQACYFLIQAIEKSIRSKIFSLVNPNIEYFREKNKTHSVESAIEFLIEIVSTDSITREQISNQIHLHVLGKTNYSQIHNNLRYPCYFKRYDSYSVLDVTKDDFDELKRRLNLLKKFLEDLNKFT
ncbi:MAG: hypothetical protein K2Y10_08545 [Burkholderiaceae bacterium]|nr:hypothetical protein [Burkholderiaceae bacterium]